MDAKELRKLLQKPFPDYAIRFRVDALINTSKGTLYRVVPYLDVRFITNRLNMLVPGEWSLDVSLEPFSFPTADGKGYLVVGWKAKAVLTILSVSMTGTGSSFIGETDTQKALRQLVKLDPKAAETDAIRRAAANHGIGAYLWFFKDTVLLTDEERKLLETKQFSKYSSIQSIRKALDKLRVIGEKVYAGQLEDLTSGE